MPEISYDGQDLPLLWEQIRNCAGGVDAFSDPAELAKNANQQLTNLLVRDKAKARTRPGADALGGVVTPGVLLADDGTPLLSDADVELVPDSSVSGPITGLFYFNTPTYQQLVSVRSSAFRFWNSTLWTDMPTTGWPAAARVAMAQGVDKLLCSDGTNNMRVWDGANFTDGIGGAAGTDCGNGTNDPPVGATILCWHTGRMFASGIATLPDTILVSNRLAVGKGQWNNTTRSFRVGMGEGDPIMALKSYIGITLAVGKLNSIWLVDTDPNAEPADFSAKTLGESLNYGAGVCGPMAWDTFGNDIFLVSPDRQVRTLQRMVSASGQYQLSAPLSEPVQPYIDRINAFAQNTIAVKKYLEFVLFAVPLDSATSPNAVLVYNGRLGQWIGIWDGWTPTMWEVTRFGGQLRLVFGDIEGNVNQWKDNEDRTADATYLDNGVGYASKLWTRNLSFGDPETDKIGFNTRMRFNGGNAGLTLTAVGDDADLKTWSSNVAPAGDLLGTGILGSFLLQSSAPVMLPGSLRDTPSFREMFLKIESPKGWWELRNLSVSARPRPMRSK